MVEIKEESRFMGCGFSSDELFEKRVKARLDSDSF
jgi:hypothetical protein